MSGFSLPVPLINALLATMAAATAKGQPVGGSGAPVDLTAAQLAAIVGSVGGALISKVITLTRSVGAVDGSVAYTGVGFTPSAIVFFGSVANNTAASIGFVDSAKGGACIWMASDAATWSTNSTPIFYSNAATSVAAQGTISTFDADGFTISWAKSGAPSASLIVKALCLR